MNDLLFVDGLALLALVLVWAFGSVIARVVGVVMVLDGVGGFVVHGTAAVHDRYLIELGVGVGLWLFGHWLYALKHGVWRSRLGRAVWRLPVLALIAPAS